LSKNKYERIVALIFGSGSERIMAFDCTSISPEMEPKLSAAISSLLICNFISLIET